VRAATGAVMFVQRLGGLVNSNVHFHVVIPDRHVPPLLSPVSFSTYRGS